MTEREKVDLLVGVFVLVVMIAFAFLFETVDGFDCLDDQLMTSDGVCLDVDSILDAAHDYYQGGE